MTDPLRLAAAVLFLASAGAAAQGADCDSAADQASLTECADTAYRAADARLNATFRTLRARLDADAAIRLRDAQRAWIAYRDAMCAFIGGPTEGGSVHDMVLLDCLADLTDRQTDLLVAQATCEEGDVSCAGR